MTGLEDVTAASFEPHVGQEFRLATEPASLVFTLARVKQHSFEGPTRTAFSLFFRGPAEPILPQAIYALDHAELGALEIFIVPVGRDEQGTEYEAAFS